MKTIKCVSSELRKSVVSPSFLICIGISFVFFFTANCYTNFDTGKTYSIFNTLFMDKIEFAKYTGLSSFDIFIKAKSSWLTMFIPIIAAFPFVPVFCDERSSGGIRISIFRTGKFRYCFSKFLSSLICGGLAIMIGYALFGICIFSMFSPLAVYPMDYEFIKSVLIQLLQMFLFGAFFSLPAFVLSSFIRNKYIIMCIPFVIKYAYDQSILSLYNMALREGKYHRLETLEYFNSISLLNVSLYEKKLLYMIFIIIIMSLCFATFLLFMSRRFDSGA